MSVYQLIDELVFPQPACADPDGLLAVGGDLSVKRLLLAYQMGIFPWYTEETPILWWSPDPRLILEPDSIKISKSLQRVIKKGAFKITLDEVFADVIRGCAQAKRPQEQGTWIVDDMVEAYCRMHAAGYAHSVESWLDGELVGGLYGVSLGNAFFGESMFSRVNDASKVALVHLVRLFKSWGFDLIDCQVASEHLLTFGAHEIPRPEFLRRLKNALRFKTRRGKWKFPEDGEQTEDNRQRK